MEHYNEANRLANALETQLGIKEGDTVVIIMTFTPPAVSLHYALWKIGAIPVPIFSGYGIDAISRRIGLSRAKVIFTQDGYYRAGRKINLKEKVDSAIEDLDIEKVIVHDTSGFCIPWNGNRDVRWSRFIENQPANYDTKSLSSEHPAWLIFTSGTTGEPKGTILPHSVAIVSCSQLLWLYHEAEQTDTVYWAGDLGWIVGPLTMSYHHFGSTILLLEGLLFHPKPDRLWSLIERYRVNSIFLPPTAQRMFMSLEEDVTKKYDLSSLKVFLSTAEPWGVSEWEWAFKDVCKENCPMINMIGGTEALGPWLWNMPVDQSRPGSFGRHHALGNGVDVVDDKGKSIRDKLGYLVNKGPVPFITRGLWQGREAYLEEYFSKPKICNYSLSVSN